MGEEMQATVDRKALKAALTDLKRVQPSGKATLPILKHVHVSANGNSVWFTATDLDVRASVTLKAYNTSPGAFTLELKALAAQLRVLMSDRVTLSPAGLTADGVTFPVPSFDAGEFPSESTSEPSTRSFSIAPDVFRAMSGKVSPFVSADETRYTLMGINLELDPDNGNTLTATATDGHGLITTDAPLVAWSQNESWSGIMPVKALRFVSGRTKRSKTVEPVRITLFDTFWCLATDTLSVTARALDGPYPNYRQVIPNHEAYTSGYDLDVPAMSAACETLKPLADPEMNGLDFAFDGETCKVSAGDTSLSAACRGDSEPASMRFNVKYVLSILKALPDATGLFLTGPTKATIIESPHGKALLMPLRMS